MKKSGSGKLGEAFKSQEKMSGGSGSMGGISSGSSPGGYLKSLAVESHSAYRNQDKMSGGLHGGAAAGGNISKDYTTSNGGAYGAQAKAKDGGGTTKLSGTECLAGETGKYLGHFRQEKFLRMGHNSDGVISMDGADVLPNAINQAMKESRSSQESDADKREDEKDIKQAFQNGVREMSMKDYKGKKGS